MYVESEEHIDIIPEATEDEAWGITFAYKNVLCVCIVSKHSSMYKDMVYM